MPTLPWSQMVNPNYVFLLPELFLLGTTLLVMILDLYIKEKRTLVWITLSGILLSLIAVWYGANDPAIAAAIVKSQPKEFFGNMVVADSFSFFMKAVLLGVAALVVLLSVDYVEKFLSGMFLEFYQVMLAATLGMMLMISSRDLIAIYIGLELASICSYVLAGLLRKDPRSNEAALKYFLNGTLASAVLLFGVSLLYGVSGTTYLPGISAALQAYATGSPGLAGIAGTGAGMIPLIVVGILFVVAGFGFKVAAAPLHLWAPDAYEGAPTPVTGFFSVGPKGAAFAAILRIFLVGLGVDLFIGRWMIFWAVLATASMFLGNLTALVQTNVKRMMAYSSIAQAGYILVGVVAAGVTHLGSSAVLYYVLAYAVTNIGIFAILTHMDREGGSVTVNDFKGLAGRNPVYAWSLLICFISLIGIPPTVGFMGKFFLIRAIWETSFWWLAVLIAVNSAISVGYYYGIVKAMFLEPAERESLAPSAGVMVTVVISVVGVILVGLMAGPVVAYTNLAGLLK